MRRLAERRKITVVPEPSASGRRVDRQSHKMGFVTALDAQKHGLVTLLLGLVDDVGDVVRLADCLAAGFEDYVADLQSFLRRNAARIYVSDHDTLLARTGDRIGRRKGETETVHSALRGRAGLVLGFLVVRQSSELHRDRLF